MSITDDIVGGQYDDELDHIVDAVRDRKERLARRLMAELQEGDTVQLIGDFKPRYLHGATGIVKEVRQTKIGLRFDDDIHDPYGKYAGKTWIIPATLLKKIA